MSSPSSSQYSSATSSPILSSNKRQKTQTKDDMTTNIDNLSIRHLARSLKALYDADRNESNRNHSIDYHLPIKSIDDLLVSAVIIIRYAGVTLIVKSSRIFGEFGDYISFYSEPIYNEPIECTHPHTFNGNNNINNDSNKGTDWCNNCNQLEMSFFENGLKALRKTIRNLKFNTYHGKFETRKQYINVSDWGSLFSVPTSTVRLYGDPCSVCYDQTICKTDCSHALCYRCWSAVEKQYDSEPASCGHIQSIIPCPICRDDITYMHDDDDSD